MQEIHNDWLEEIASLLNSGVSASDCPDSIADIGSSEPIVDLKTLEWLRGAIGDASAPLIDELVEILEQEALRLIPQMLEAARTDNAEELEYAAHTFKGSSRNLGLARLVLLNRELELMGRAGDLSNAEHLVAQVAEAYQEALPALKDVLDG